MAARAIESEQQTLLALVREHGPAIRATVESYGGGSPRLVGSVARGEEHQGDVDILVDNVRMSLLRLVRLEDELANLLGIRVNVAIARKAAAAHQHSYPEAVPL